MTDAIDLYVDLHDARNRVQWYERDLQRARETLDSIESQVARLPFKLTEAQQITAVVNRKREREEEKRAQYQVKDFEDGLEEKS